MREELPPSPVEGAPAALRAAGGKTDATIAPPPPPEWSDVGAGHIAQLMYEHRERLPMFVVYRDAPDLDVPYAARMWLTLPKGEATNVVLGFASLRGARDALSRLGLTNLGRDVNDEPQIVESWV